MGLVVQFEAGNGVVMRNLECWVEQLKGHVEAGTSRKDLLEFFPTLLNAIGYMADASAESIGMSARSSALINLRQTGPMV